MATVIFRLAFFPLSLLAALLLAWPAWAGVSLSLGSLRHTSFEADGVKVDFAARRAGEADIAIERLKVAGIEYRRLVLHCADFVLDLSQLDCPRGEIRRADERGRDRPSLPFSFAYRFGDGRLELAVEGTDVVAWSPLIKRLRGWQPAGTVDLRLMADRRQAQLSIALKRLKFGNKAGDIAGEGIDIMLDATASRGGNGWKWQTQLDWPRGELYVAPWYRRAGIKVKAEGILNATVLSVDLARLDLAGIGQATAALNWDRRQGELADWGFVTEPLDLATAFREWVQPWLDRSAVPKVSAAGVVRFAGAWSKGAWQSFYAGLENARLVDGTDYLEFGGMNAHIPWERGVISEAEFSVDSARLGDLPLGAFRIPVRLHDNEASLKDLAIPLLDGRLDIAELVATRHDDGWRGLFSGGVEGVSMPKLTRALKLPLMAGTFTARIPTAVFENHVLTLGGALAIQVFDGSIIVPNLKVIDPLSANQRFVTDVAARNLDLGMLTQTFSFGSILGRLDLDLAGLELSGWQPVRFDAKVASSPGNYRRAISRGALQDISALGGAAGAAAVGLSPAGFFNTFDYERIGFTCVLRQGVCQFEGLEPSGTGYVVVKGSGIPSVQVIGYNRRIDWNLLVSRIRAVIAGKSKAVIE